MQTKGRHVEKQSIIVLLVFCIAGLCMEYYGGLLLMPGHNKINNIICTLFIKKNFIMFLRHKLKWDM